MFTSTLNFRLAIYRPVLVYNTGKRMQHYHCSNIMVRSGMPWETKQQGLDGPAVLVEIFTLSGVISKATRNSNLGRLGSGGLSGESRIWRERQL